VLRRTLRTEIDRQAGLEKACSEPMYGHSTRNSATACLFVLAIIVLAIMKLHDFFVEHAKFPFPPPDEYRSAGTTDISQFEVASLKREWKAGHAVRDDTLVQKLCQALKDILGDTPLAAGAENYLLASFSPQLQVDERGGEDRTWATNLSEAQVGI
jgi:hypothetical protein